jgi:putative lipoic acid-binding regulatory protein
MQVMQLMDEERARAIALLEATHEFPTEYHLSVIAFNVEAVFTEVVTAIEAGLPAPLPSEAHEAVPSSGGKYSSHRFRVPCARAEDVLELYARLKLVKGVVTIL